MLKDKGKGYMSSDQILQIKITYPRGSIHENILLHPSLTRISMIKKKSRNW
jgi:hypothetical protein